MTDQDKGLLQKFRDAREKYQEARFAKQPTDGPLKVYADALHSLLLLDDESLRTIASEAWEYFGKDNEFAHGQIAENMLVESVEPDPHSTN